MLSLFFLIMENRVMTVWNPLPSRAADNIYLWLDMGCSAILSNSSQVHSLSLIPIICTSSNFFLHFFHPNPPALLASLSWQMILPTSSDGTDRNCQSKAAFLSARNLNFNDSLFTSNTFKVMSSPLLQNFLMPCSPCCQQFPSLPAISTDLPHTQVWS